MVAKSKDFAKAAGYYAEALHLGGTAWPKRTRTIESLVMAYSFAQNQKACTETVLRDAPSMAQAGSDMKGEQTIVLSGPARPGEGLAQAEVDSVMAPLAPALAEGAPAETLSRIAALNENERLAAFS